MYTLVAIGAPVAVALVVAVILLARARRKHLKRIAALWSELGEVCLDLWLVRPSEGPHHRMASEWLGAVRNVTQRLGATWINGLTALEQFAAEVKAAADDVMAQPGAKNRPPLPEELAVRNLEPFGSEQLWTKLEQFLRRYAEGKFELQQDDHPFHDLDFEGGKLVGKLLYALFQARLEGWRAKVYQEELEAPEPEPIPDIIQRRAGSSLPDLGIAPEQELPEEVPVDPESTERERRRRQYEGLRDLSRGYARQARLDIMAAIEALMALYGVPDDDPPADRPPGEGSANN
jgi:hypothetical protein